MLVFEDNMIVWMDRVVPVVMHLMNARRRWTRRFVDLVITPNTIIRGGRGRKMAKQNVHLYQIYLCIGQMIKILQNKIRDRRLFCRWLHIVDMWVDPWQIDTQVIEGLKGGELDSFYGCYGLWYIELNLLGILLDNDDHITHVLSVLIPCSYFLVAYLYHILCSAITQDKLSFY